MTLHDEAASLLAGWTAPTAEQQLLRQRYLQVLNDHPEAVTRDGHPDHLTASTLVMSADGARVLLTLHAKAQRWFQFGGHCEPGDATLVGAALREAVEESGILGLRLDPEPLQLSDHAVPFCGATGAVHHLDVRFLAVVPDHTDFATSPESLDVAWWPANALPDPDPDLIELVDLAAERLRSRQSGQAGRLGGGDNCAAVDQPSR